MKKFGTLLLVSAMVMSMAACGSSDTTTESSSSVESEAVVSEPNEAPVEETHEAVVEESVEEEQPEIIGMSYADYVATELNTEITIGMYVQATQSWWDDKITVYGADEDGAYFVYNMACSEEDAQKLVPGTPILVTGVKTEWSGEIEIADATFEFVDAEPYFAETIDVTALLGTDELINYQNRMVCFTDMTVTLVSFKNEEPGDDIYVNFEKDGQEYYFCLEYYLNGSDEEFYNTVGSLEAGQVVDVYSYLYWYEGPNPHIIGLEFK